MGNVNTYSKSPWPYCELVRIFLKMAFQLVTLEVEAEAPNRKGLFQLGIFYDFHVLLDGSVAEDNWDRCEVGSLKRWEAMMKVLTRREKNVKECNPHLLKKINFPAGRSRVNGTSTVGWWERFLTHFPGERNVSSPSKDRMIMKVWFQQWEAGKGDRVLADLSLLKQHVDMYLYIFIAN